MNFCGRDLPFFRPRFLGEKSPARDFIVEVVEAAADYYFFVQVKATRKGYTKRGRRLKVGVSMEDVSRLSRMSAPAYLVGVDEPNDLAYILAILPSTTGPIASMPTNFPLDCTHLPRLHREVVDYWTGRDTTRLRSSFTV